MPGGSWCDMHVSAVNALIICGLSVVIANVPPILSFLQRLDMFCLAFCAGTLTTVVRI